MIEAVLFDMDGTLYLQARLRALMTCELVTVPWLQRAPWRVGRLWRALKVFRHVREELRDLGRPSEPLERLQYSVAAARAGMTAEELEATVTEWIVQRPLKYLPHVVRPGTRETLARLRNSGLRVGVFSDYPAADKLKAMKLDHLISLTIDATDAEVNAFKPHPRGFHEAAARWGVPPRNVLYVGDRPDVDAPGARAAGMPCAVIGRQLHEGNDGTFLPLATMADLTSLVERSGS